MSNEVPTIGLGDHDWPEQAGAARVAVLPDPESTRRVVENGDPNGTMPLPDRSSRTTRGRIRIPAPSATSDARPPSHAETHAWTTTVSA
jgi:hypothetical protein